MADVIAALESIDGMPSEDVVPALPHLLQTAALLQATGDDELVVAGLLHDVASALDSRCGDHAAAGADLVRPLFGDRVARLVGGHTDAKRYLVTVEPWYTTGLSANSTMTLVGQGGVMTAEEVIAFRARAHGDDLVALRRADDAAKEPGRQVPPVAAYAGALEAVRGRTAGR